MKLMTTLFLSLMLILTACSNKSSQVKADNRLLEDPEHHIKDNHEITKHDSTVLYTGWYYVINIDNGYKRQLEKSSDTFFIDRHPIVTATNFTTFEIYESDAGETKYIGLAMKLDKKGTESWSLATKKSIGKQLAFILDNRLLCVATVNTQITSGMTALNSGNYSRAELENIKAIIESER